MNLFHLNWPKKCVLEDRKKHASLCVYKCITHGNKDIKFEALNGVRQLSNFVYLVHMPSRLAENGVL